MTRKKTLLLVVLACVISGAVLLIGWGQRAENMPKYRSTQPAQKIAEASFRDLQGGQRSIAEFVGKVVLLNFWATWCAPCVREMPSLNRLQEKLGPEGLVVIALSEDRGAAKEKVAPFIKTHNLTHLLVAFDDKGKLARLFKVQGLPTSIVINRAGDEVGRLVGAAEWDQQPAIDTLRRHLDEPAPER